MVQVDVVWSYAFGATFAAAASKQLEKEEKPFNNKWYVFVLLFLSIFFAPSGIYLLWQFPQWETMQVATCREDIPAWLVTIFAVTNITQGIVGYWTGWKLSRKKLFYAAHANWMVAWIIFWFILACGWDGTGYQRFLYDASVHGGALWQRGTHMGLEFFYRSNVWWTLVVMGLFFAPMLVHGMIRGVREGVMVDSSLKDKLPGAITILAVFFSLQWVVCLGLAILVTVIVIKLGDIFGHIGWGYLAGLPLCAIVYYLLLFRKGMVMDALAKKIYVRE